MEITGKTRSGAASPITPPIRAGAGIQSSNEGVPTHSQASLGELAASAGRRADEAAVAAGRRLEAAAESLRHHSPSSGILADVSQQIVSTLDSSGRYLEEHGVSGVAEDLTQTMRRHPIPALFVALGLGFVLARATSARSN